MMNMKGRFGLLKKNKKTDPKLTYKGYSKINFHIIIVLLFHTSATHIQALAAQPAFVNLLSKNSATRVSNLLFTPSMGFSTVSSTG